MPAPPVEIQRKVRIPTCTILNGQTVSSAASAVDLRGFGVGWFTIPTGWDGGATVTFQVSADNTTYVALNKNSSDVAWSITVTAAKAYQLPADIFGSSYFKIVSASAVGADRIIQLSLSA